MPQTPKVIDPNDPLHEAVDRLPMAKRMELFGSKTAPSTDPEEAEEGKVRLARFKHQNAEFRRLRERGEPSPLDEPAKKA